MNPSLPTVRPRQIARAAEKVGFGFDCQRGSHAVHIRESDGQGIVIPMDEDKETD